MNFSTDTFLLFAPILLLWFAAGYFLPNGSYLTGRLANGMPLRSRGMIGFALIFLLEEISVGMAAGALGGWHHARWLCLLIIGAALLLPGLRKSCPTKYHSEFEVAVNIAVASGVWAIIHGQHLGLSTAVPIALFGPAPRTAAYLLAAGLLIFLVRGGTHIVRGVLDRGGTMPPDPNSVGSTLTTAQVTELRHGRLIGNVERLILALLVANGQYTSLAFFFAAKGLIRSKELEDRRWVDYLLLGSLTSFLVAVVVGLLIAGLLAAAPAK